MPERKQKLSIKPTAKTQKVTEAGADWVEKRQPEQVEVITPTEEIKTKRITFEVPETQHQAIKILATKKGMTIKELMISLVERELEQ